MVEKIDFVHFRQGLPFYDMVTSFMVAIAGSLAIFDRANPMHLAPDQYVSVPGVIVDGRHFLPYEVFQLAETGKISRSTLLLLFQGDIFACQSRAVT